MESLPSSGHIFCCVAQGECFQTAWQLSTLGSVGFGFAENHSRHPCWCAGVLEGVSSLFHQAGWLSDAWRVNKPTGTREFFG